MIRISGLKSFDLKSASLAVFQIPEAIKDPRTRAFASLAACRSFAGLVYGPIFPLYFRSKLARSVHLAFLWSEVCGLKASTFARPITDYFWSQEKAPTFFSPWTILSLPAVTTIWCVAVPFIVVSIANTLTRGMLFFSLAAISYVWNTTGEANVSVSPTSSAQFAPVLRVAIACSAMLDLVGLFWIWMLLWRDTKMCLGKVRTNDGSYPTSTSAT
jgi:hypothetical protein